MISVQNQIPNQYANLDSMFAYVIPSDTFTTDAAPITYQCRIARKDENQTLGRCFGDATEDARWLSFNPTTRALTGVPTGFGQKRSYQLVIEATDNNGDVAYAHFIMAVTEAGIKPMVRWDTTFNHTITGTNIGSFSWGSVLPGETVFIDPSVGNPSVSNGANIESLSDSGAIICWGINNTNKNTLDYGYIQGGDTIGLMSGLNNYSLSLSLGTFTVPNGTSDNPVFVTNYGSTVTVDNGGANRLGLSFGAGMHRFIFLGQGDHDDPYGVKITSTLQPAFGIKGAGLLDTMEVGWIEVPGTKGIGFHLKVDFNCAGSATRPANDWNGLNVHDCWIHDCTNPNGIGGSGGEGVYSNVGFYTGNTTVCPGTLLFSNDYRNVRLEFMIVERSGWDGFQAAGNVENCKVNYNYVADSGIGGTNPTGVLPASAHTHCFQLNVVGEFAYNFGINAPGSFVRGGTGSCFTFWHHNIAVRCLDSVFYFNKGGGDNGFITTSYGGAGSIPNFAHKSRSDLTESELFNDFLNNTAFECGQFTKGFHDMPNCRIANNIAIRCTNTNPGWTNSVIFNNIINDTADPNIYFADYANLDFRIKSGSPADGGGVDVGMTFDFNGKPIATSFAVGAFEVQSQVNRDQYNFVVNDTFPPPVTYFKWYSAPDLGGAPDMDNLSELVGETSRELTLSTWNSLSSGVWVVSGGTPIAKTGAPQGQENFKSTQKP